MATPSPTTAYYQLIQNQRSTGLEKIQQGRRPRQELSNSPSPVETIHHCQRLQHVVVNLWP